MVFRAIVKTSIWANWLILAVILLRFLLKRAPKRVICILWAVVAVRLLLPFSIESPVSMIPQTTVSFQEAVDTSLIHIETAPPVNTTVATLPGTEIGESAPTSRASVLPVVWSAGVAGMLGYLLISYLRMRHLVREAIPEEGKIWVCDAVTSPFILGLIRPRIYLPSGLSERNREYVLAHEESHLRCKDHWWKPLAFCLLALYWFDPLVWAAYFLVCRDIEFACDERVISKLAMPQKKAYASALLECSGSRRLVLVCPVAFGETEVVRRIRMVLNYKKPGFWIILLSLILILAAAIGFLTVPAARNAPAENLNEPILEESVSPTTGSVLETEATVPPREEEPNPTEESDSEWAQYPDGIRIDTYKGETFTAHIMLVRDPSRVYLATSSDELSMDTSGIRMDEALEKENATAAINAGYYWDDGTESVAVGSVPTGLTLSKNSVVWNQLQDMVPERGFVGFNEDNILIVAPYPFKQIEAQSLEIRDGVSAGPALVLNGESMTPYEGHSGYTLRTAIGQRSDGTVILLCTDGRNENAVGATHEDVIDILTSYGAINACLLNGGSSTNMLYRDTEGRYGEKGSVQVFIPESAISTGTTLRRQPTFWMVK